MRAAIYVRVSTDEQAKEGFSIPAQRERLAAFALSQGWGVASEYVDDGFSGKNLQRPAMQRLIADVRARRVDVVLVWRLDRVSRRQLHVLQLLEEELEPHGVGFKSATEPFDTTTPAGKAMLGMLAVFAQLEREVIIERVRFAQEQRVIRDGLWHGPPPYGYRYVAKGTIEPDPDTAPVVRRIFRDAVAGDGHETVAAHLASDGVPPPSGARWYGGTVGKILANRVYCGERRWNGSWIASEFEPLIDEGLWLRARAASASRQGGMRPGKGEASPFMLVGLTRCQQCGSPMRGWTATVRRRDHKHNRYYLCDRTRRQHVLCGPGYLRAEKLEAAVEAEILAGNVVLGQEEAADLADLQRQARDVDARMKRLLDAIEVGAVTVDEARSRMVNLRAKRLELEEALQLASVEQSALADQADVAAALQRLPAEWPHLTPLEKQRALRILVRRIEVAPDGRPTIIV